MIKFGLHFHKKLPSYLHHLALINLSEVSSDGIHYLARPSPSTQFSVFWGGGGWTLLTLPSPASTHRAAAHHPGLWLRHGGRALVLAEPHEAELLPHVYTLLAVWCQHVVPGTLALPPTLSVHTPSWLAKVWGQGTLVYVLTHHCLE